VSAAMATLQMPRLHSRIQSTMATSQACFLTQPAVLVNHKHKMRADENAQLTSTVMDTILVLTIESRLVTVRYPEHCEHPLTMTANYIVNTNDPWP
jgi:hypothetical protein